MPSRPMYGGAMELDLPESFVDTSDFREVPDHQEVWADMTSNQSMILEVLDHTEGMEGVELAKFHFEEIGKGNGCKAGEMKVVEATELTPEELPHFSEAVSRTLLRGEQTVAKFNETAKNTVQLELLVVRLAPPHNTDLLLTVNTPTAVNPESTESAAPTATSSPFSSICQTLVIKDYGLFGA